MEKLIGKIDLNEFKKRENHISVKMHKSRDMLIWNYRANCQYDRAWDIYTLSTRGLITDGEGNIIARPFTKFFNIGEREFTRMENLPVEIPKIYEKLDGSLGIQYVIDKQLNISTRGSFESDQAIWATKWIRGNYTVDDFKVGHTYLYEIIYPENRIVIDYGDRKELVLLAVISIETGEEIDYVDEALRLRMNYAKEIHNHDLQGILKVVSKLSSDEEGFVVKYRNGLRVKIKGEEYVRLHRVLSTFSNKSIWECLSNGTDIDEIIGNIPDEFYGWVKKKKKEFEEAFADILNTATEVYNRVKDLSDRKSQALEILKSYKDGSAVVFSMLDSKKNINQIIWKKLKPKYEKPFKDIEGGI